MTIITVVLPKIAISIIFIFQNHASIKVRVQQMSPDLTEVGSTLEEAKALRQEHDELVLKLNVRCSYQIYWLCNNLHVTIWWNNFL